MDPALIPALHDALVVAQTGSVGEAARRLHKTASAVSQQLRRIEQRFGVALFERAGRGLRPSPAGETVLGSLTRLFEEASSLEGLLDALATERVTMLRVAASDYLGEALLLPVLRRLAADAHAPALRHHDDELDRSGAAARGRPGRRGDGEHPSPRRS